MYKFLALFKFLTVSLKYDVLAHLLFFKPILYLNLYLTSEGFNVFHNFCKMNRFILFVFWKVCL